ncbi:glycosyltransferase family 2 protein [Citreicella sp. C3M06]|uniref:glycosyltransferase family 2 protein n=1 Tax=Citreicella sp. C3M06 TaxID=2841564 RepID=UPI001C093FD3|nr:glycosyltransferase family 2 protein [Citreicella sp. C3M06]
MALYAPEPDDIRIVGHDLTDRPGLSLVSVLRNESYLLPAFLEHYRALGVDRFVLLDDRSDDGSATFLAEQPDVMLLQSSRRYGDSVPESERPPTVRSNDYRQIHLWRSALANRFCDGRWMMQCDIDEFACLPPGRRLPDLCALLDQRGEAGAWGGMIDLYPAHVSDLAPGAPGADDPRGATWYFDGTRHFSLRDGGPPRHRYEGARSRLNRSLIDGQEPLSLRARLKLKWLGARKSPSGRFVKPLLQKWQRGTWYLSSHEISRPLSAHILIPLLHYRYTPALYAKVAWAITDGGYSKGNSDYHTIDKLLEAMARKQAGFLGPNSRKLTGYADLKATGNAIGLD